MYVRFCSKRMFRLFVFGLVLILASTTYQSSNISTVKAQEVTGQKFIFWGPSNADISDADRYLTAYCAKGLICKTGDFNGDGRRDIVAFFRNSHGNEGDVYVTLATNDGTMGESRFWHKWFCAYDEICDVGDFNGDGLDDIVTFVRDPAFGPGRGDVRIAVSNGHEFVPSPIAPLWHDWFCIRQEVCATGDVNGDGKDDIIAFIRYAPDHYTEFQSGTVVVALSDGKQFLPSDVASIWGYNICFDDERCFTGDVNTDGKDDLIVVSDTIRVALSRGDSFGPIRSYDFSACAPIASAVCDIRIGNYDNRYGDDILAVDVTRRWDACFSAVLTVSTESVGFAQSAPIRFC